MYVCVYADTDMHTYIHTHTHTLWIKEMIDILEVKSILNVYHLKSSEIK